MDTLSTIDPEPQLIPILPTTFLSDRFSRSDYRLHN